MAAWTKVVTRTEKWLGLRYSLQEGMRKLEDELGQRLEREKQR